MATIPAILGQRADSYDNFYSANLVYRKGEVTHVLSGANAGRSKTGDGIRNWRNLPWDLPQIDTDKAAQAARDAQQDAAIATASSVASTALSTANTANAAANAATVKNVQQDTRLNGHDNDISNLSNAIAAFEGAMIIIGSIALNTENVTPNALTARAIALKGTVKAGYTIQDLGQTDEPGRFHYWQYQADLTWVDLGERGDVSKATDSSLGIVQGNTADYEPHVRADGVLENRGLAGKIGSMDVRDNEQDESIQENEIKIDTMVDVMMNTVLMGARALYPEGSGLFPNMLSPQPNGVLGTN